MAPNPTLKRSMSLLTSIPFVNVNILSPIYSFSFVVQHIIMYIFWICNANQLQKWKSKPKQNPSKIHICNNITSTIIWFRLYGIENKIHETKYNVISMFFSIKTSLSSYHKLFLILKKNQCPNVHNIRTLPLNPSWFPTMNMNSNFQLVLCIQPYAPTLSYNDTSSCPLCSIMIIQFYPSCPMVIEQLCP